MWTSRRRPLDSRRRVTGGPQGRRAVDRAPGSVVLVLAVALACPGAARSATSLGGQRAGPASGTFLQIGVGARAVAMGESFVAVANDPSTVYWNPAGLASLQRREVSESHVEWPADIHYDHLTLVLPSTKLGGSIAFQMGILGTQIQETTELSPFGTGRDFSYSDLVAGATYARRWTDKLLVGAGAKFIREDLGSQVGGPVTRAVLFDAGSIFYLGLGSVRIATSLTNFGAALKPSGTYISPYTGEHRYYDGFDPPLMFRYGVAFEPLENPVQRLTTSLEVDQPADNQQTFKLGTEWTYRHTFALRTGYNFEVDELKFSAGTGFNTDFGSLHGTFDYAYTDAGFLGAIHRVSLGVRF
jgi:hypothetical protein